MTMGLTRSDTPRISPMFAMFDPIIFPKTKPVTLLLIAEIEVNNSGADVAIDTTVNPTRIGGMPRLVARSFDESDSKSPVLTKMITPNKTHRTRKKELRIPLVEPIASDSSWSKVCIN